MSNNGGHILPLGRQGDLPPYIPYKATSVIPWRPILIPKYCCIAARLFRQFPPGSIWPSWPFKTPIKDQLSTINFPVFQTLFLEYGKLWLRGPRYFFDAWLYGGRLQKRS